MTRRKLSPGIHFVNIKGKDGKKHRRKVKVLKNGRWKFLKTPKSGSKKKKRSTSKKSPSRKSRSTKSTKSKSKKSGGKKMSKSRLSPFNKNGVKIVTAGLLLTLVGSFFDRGNGKRSPYDYVKAGDAGKVVNAWSNRIRGIYTNAPWKSIGAVSLVVAGASKATGVKGISFIQFS